MKRSMVFEGVAVTLLILLAFLMLAMVTGGSAERQIGGTEQVQYIYSGADGTLYAFTDGAIQAIDGGGNTLWKLELPGESRVCYGWYYYPDDFYVVPEVIYEAPDVCNITAMPGDPIVFADNGTLYAYLGGPSGSGLMSGELVAISPGGKIAWSLPVESLAAKFSYRGDQYYSDARIYAKGDRVYVFHDYNETVLDAAGNVLWNVENVSDPAAVDDEGRVYLTPSHAQTATYSQPFVLYTNAATGKPVVGIPDYRVPSAVIDAFNPNGTLCWSETPGELMYRQYMGRGPLPVYHNGSLYVGTIDGIKALYLNGTVKWSTRFDTADFRFSNLTDYTGGDLRLYGLMPFDRDGNVYVEYVSRLEVPYDNFTRYAQSLCLIALGPDGRELSRQQLYENKYLAAADGIAYATTDSLVPPFRFRAQYSPDAADNLTAMGTESLIAFDVKGDKELWNYTFPVDHPTIAVIDENDEQELIGGYDNNNGRYGRIIITKTEVPEVVANGGRVFAYFRSRNWESPVVYGRSKCAYVSGIYAFNNSGALLWNRTISPDAYSLGVAGNSTIYYRTDGGKLVVTGAGAVAGFALTTLAYVFIRFLCLGAVARAQARVNKNKNRDVVYRFIVENPGSTVYEISRGTGMNKGTIRYHVFILGLNHKIVSSRMDGKRIRHFTNSNTYNREEQLILSLARRSTIGKILALLLQKPGISNVEISRELGITESEVSRYMGEMEEKGVVKNLSSGRERAYSIHEAYSMPVADAIRRLQGP